MTVCSLALGACEYDIPISSTPTRKIDEKLLGDWKAENGTKMKVRMLDDFIYIVDFYDPDDGNILLRAFHSDVSKTPFVSAQIIESVNRRYFFLAWKISKDGKHLGIRVVDEEIIPMGTKDSAAVQNLLKKNLRSPKLAVNEMQFTLVKSLSSPPILPADEAR